MLSAQPVSSLPGLSTLPSPVSLLLVEALLTGLALVVAVAFPAVLSSSARAVERVAGRLARRKRLAVVSVGLLCLLLRLAALPWLPVPHPFLPDDFSFLLSADTFLHGRLANPTPPLWHHFESLQIDLVPTYGSMYFPGEGLALALGKLLFGTPWAGMLAASALACAAVCWMLQAWLPPRWALLGGVLMVLRLGVFSYWVNTYTGAGMLAAIGGALVLGGYPRLRRALASTTREEGSRLARHGYALTLAAGIVLLLLTRPFEGFLLCLPVLVALLLSIAAVRPRATTLLGTAALPLALVLAAVVWLGHYDQRNFGHATTLPYTVNRATYATIPYYIWQRPRPLPPNPFPDIQRFYDNNEAALVRDIWTLPGFLRQTASKITMSLSFYCGFALLPPLFFLGPIWRDRRLRLIVLSLPVYACGILIEIFLVPHYLAAFTAAFYVVGLAGMRRLRLWRVQGRPVGRAALRLLVVVCCLVFCLRLLRQPLHLAIPEGAGNGWATTWMGPDTSLHGTARAAIVRHLEAIPGNHLVFVHYGSTASKPASKSMNDDSINDDSMIDEPLNEWIYNGADLPGARILWARAISPASDRELGTCFPGRTLWSVSPDESPVRLVPLAAGLAPGIAPDPTAGLAADAPHNDCEEKLP